MNKKIIFVCCVMGVFAIAVGGIALYYLNSQEKNRNNSKIEAIVDQAYNSADIQNKEKDEEVKETTSNNDRLSDGTKDEDKYSSDISYSELLAEDNATMITEAYADNVVLKMKQLNSEFNFSEANDLALKTLRERVLDDSEASKILNRMYQDSATLNNLSIMKTSYQQNNYKDFLSVIIDKDNFFIAVMYLDRPERTIFISDRNSLNPIFRGGIEIKSVTDIDPNSTLFIESSYMNFNMTNLWEYQFVIEGNEMIAYVGKGDKGYFIQKIEEVNKGTTNYLTLAQWDDAYKR